MKLVWILIRTPASVARTLELLPCFKGDPRVKYEFVFCPGSRFAQGTKELIKQHGWRAISVKKALKLIRKNLGPQLIVSASEWIDFTPFHPIPVIVVPHGLGLHKMVPEPDSKRSRQSGVVADKDMAMGHVLMVTTHPNIEEQLLGISTETKERVVIEGDTSYDLITISRRRRPEYRARFGVEDSQLLVAVSCTWGKGALLDEWADALCALLGSLPSSRYRVALMLHPNMWAWWAKYGIEAMLEPHRLRGGLILVQPDYWHSLVVAADAFVGDVGSPTLYAAMAGVPTAFGVYQDSVVARGTVMEEAKGLIRHIDRNADLRREIDDLIALHDPTLAERLRAKLIAKPLDALEGFRKLFYGRLALDPPPGRMPVYVAADPQFESQEVWSYRDYPTVDGETIVLERFPREAPPSPEFADREGHLVSESEERDNVALEEASVVADPAMYDSDEVEERLERLRSDCPGSKAVAARTRNGCEILYHRLNQPDERFSVKVLAKKLLVPVTALVSAVHSLMLQARDVIGRFVVRFGVHSVAVLVTRVVP